MMYPFSDDFSDYDLNQDKELEYEEFAFAVMKQFPMGQPEELRVPFFLADANGDERLDMDEFVGAPFMFARKYQIKFFYETFLATNTLFTLSSSPQDPRLYKKLCSTQQYIYVKMLTIVDISTYAL